MFNLTKLSLLWEWVGELKKNVATLITEVGPSGENLLPSRSTATTGQILKLTGENKTPSWADEYRYTPPAYSETEVNTGQKWIDGKDIYSKVYTGDFPEITSSTVHITIDTSFPGEYVIDSVQLLDLTGGEYLSNFIILLSTNGTLYLRSVTSTFSNASYAIIVYYTKPDPAPETRDDDTPEEPEAKKTKKKTTK